MSGLYCYLIVPIIKILKKRNNIVDTVKWSFL